MKTFLISILVLFLAISPVLADSSEELAAIKQTAFNYMDAWYKGDKKRMKACLHKKLAKRSLRYINREKSDLRHTKASDMVRYTGGGYGEELWREGLRIDVTVLDFYKKIATVKVITPDYVEYLHLAKMDKNWVIINALYEGNTTGRER